MTHLNALKKVFAFAVLMIGLNVASQAQGFMGIHLNFSQNLDEYGENSPMVGHGINFQFMAGPSGSPFTFGAEVSLNCVSMDSWDDKYYFSESEYMDAEYMRESNSYKFLFVSRFQPKLFHRVRPYAEIRGGANLLTTTLNVTDPNAPNDCESRFLDDNRESLSWVPAFGAGGGVSIPVFGDCMALDFNASWLGGGVGNYINAADNSSHRSRTDQITYKAGFLVYFR